MTLPILPGAAVTMPPSEPSTLLSAWGAELRAVDWLAATHERPGVARQAWLGGARALLRAGVAWDAVKVPASIVYRLADSSDPERIRAILAEHKADGPTIADPGRAYYLLVPAGTAANWRTHGAECLGAACYLSVPAPSRLGPPETHWLTAPDGTGHDLCDPAAVAGLVRAALGPRGKE